MSLHKRRLQNSLEPILLGLLVVAAWQASALLIGSPYFPPFWEILKQLQAKWFSGPAHFFFINVQFVRDIVPSVGRALAGFFFSAAIAVPAGLLLGRSRRIGELVEPVIHFARTLPSVTLLPLFLLLLGLGWPMKISLIVFGTLWPILLNTIFGARAVEQEKLEAAKVFRITRWRCLLQIVLPAAGPQIFAGLRVSLSLALILMVVSEMVAASGGLGFTIVEAQRRFAIKEMWAGVLILGLVGYVLNMVFVAVERRLLRWHHAASDLKLT